MIKTKSFIFSLIALVATAGQASAQQAKTSAKPLSEQMAATAMEVWKERSKKWSYDDGVVQDGMNEIWRRIRQCCIF